VRHCVAAQVVEGRGRHRRIAAQAGRFRFAGFVCWRCCSGRDHADGVPCSANVLRPSGPPLFRCARHPIGVSVQRRCGMGSWPTHGALRKLHLLAVCATSCCGSGYFAGFFSRVNAPVTRYPTKGTRKAPPTQATQMFEGCLPRGRASVRKQRCRCEVSKGDGRSVISTPAV